MYGPADETACLLSFAVRNMLYTVLFGAVLLLFFSLAALLSNMALGASFFYGLLMALLLSLTVFAYGTLASALAGNGSAGTALLAGVVVFFVLIQMGSFTIQTGYVRSLSTVLASVVKWVSPVYHWSQGLSSISAGERGRTTGKYRDVDPSRGGPVVRQPCDHESERDTGMKSHGDQRPGTAPGGVTVVAGAGENREHGLHYRRLRRKGLLGHIRQGGVGRHLPHCQ